MVMIPKRMTYRFRGHLATMGKAIRSWTTALMSSVGVREGESKVNENQEGGDRRNDDPSMPPLGGSKNSSCSQGRTFYCSCGTKLKEEEGELVEV